MPTFMHDRLEIERLLYTDTDGELVGLDEVQLLEPPPEARIPSLERLILEADPQVAFEASLILATWGKRSGLVGLEHAFDWIRTRTEPIRPHRIWAYETALDQVAEAVGYFEEYGDDPRSCIGLYRRLLACVGPVRFDGCLQNALTRSGLRELYPDVLDAYRRGLAAGNVDDSLRLLPALSQWGGAVSDEQLPDCAALHDASFVTLRTLVDGTVNLNEAARGTLARCLRRHSDQRVRDAALAL